MTRLSTRARIAVFAAVLAVVVGVVAVYAVRARDRYERAHSAAPAVPHSELTVSAAAAGPRIVFRHTGIDNRYGLVAVVPLSTPGGARAFTDIACDRVAATADHASCLQTQRGVATTYRMRQLDSQWKVVQTDPLPGIPSRTRLSPDGSLVASTTFVSGHSYMQVGFSTATEIRRFGGASLGNLEEYRLRLDGNEVRPADRNIWGVTFADDVAFYATVGTGGRTYLVRGDLRARTLTSIRQHAECPSLSPDGRRVAYKVNVGTDGKTQWTPAVLDLRTGTQTLLVGETRNVDDQIAWLNDDTLLYGLPRAAEPGVDDVWSLQTSPTARPTVLIKQAWSPSVIR